MASATIKKGDNYNDATEGTAQQVPTDWQTALGMLTMQMQQRSNILMAALGLDDGGQLQQLGLPLRQQQPDILQDDQQQAPQQQLGLPNLHLPAPMAAAPALLQQWQQHHRDPDPQ